MATERPPKSGKNLTSQQRIGVLQEQLKKAGGHLRELTEENDQLSDKLEALQVEKQGLADTNSKLASELEAWKTKAQTAETGPTLKAASTTEPTEELMAAVDRLEGGLWSLSADSHDGLNGHSTADPAIRPGLSQRLEEMQNLVSQLAIAKKIAQSAQHEPNSNVEGAAPTSSDDAHRAEINRLKAESEREHTELMAQVCRALAVLNDLATEPVTESRIREVAGNNLDAAVIRALLATSKTLLAHLSDQSQQVTAAETALTVLRTQHTALETDKATLSEEYQTLLGKLGSMKDVLSAKLQSENRDLKQARSDLELAQRRVAEADMRAADREAEHQRVLETLTMVRTELLATQHQVEAADAELAESAEAHALQLAGLQTAKTGLETQLQRAQQDHLWLERNLEEARQTAEDLRGRLFTREQEAERHLEAEATWNLEKASYIKTVRNLQSALQDLQSEKDDEAEAVLERVRSDLDRAHRELGVYKERVSILEHQQHEAQNDLKALPSVRREAEQQGQLIGKLKHEASVLKANLAESMKKLREFNNYDNVDRRIITNLIVTFLELPYGDAKRFEILQLMSNILKFTSEQQEKVGLIRRSARPPPTESERGDQDEESFSDRWISFLLRESNVDRERRRSETGTPTSPGAAVP
ncbi:hypothetical protein IWQ60_010926 [Tieghemiomyces parasiticus]|uniref:GRIP domain-containing protein n=1 Tax=Tieghemiomyces parasiticus TaxID=78921 RepID=A0A9W7ZPC2_9FUNG|nr:hypothetical protein IWQ60_010926 [Tieghemiomyces parasiticus]